MEIIVLSMSFLFAAGIGYIPVKMMGGYRSYTRNRNKAYLKRIKKSNIMYYDNSKQELSYALYNNILQ